MPSSQALIIDPITVALTTVVTSHWPRKARVGPHLRDDVSGAGGPWAQVFSGREWSTGPQTAEASAGAYTEPALPPCWFWRLCAHTSFGFGAKRVFCRVPRDGRQIVIRGSESLRQRLRAGKKERRKRKEGEERSGREESEFEERAREGLEGRSVGRRQRVLYVCAGFAFGGCSFLVFSLHVPFPTHPLLFTLVRLIDVCALRRLNFGESDGLLYAKRERERE